MKARRISAFMLALMMCLTLLPLSARADGPKNLNDDNQTNGIHYQFCGGMPNSQSGGVYTYADPSYLGRALTPKFVLSEYENGWPARYLVEGVDYEIVRWSNNVNAGEASVTVRGIGNYTGERDLAFKIDAMLLNNIDFEIDAPCAVVRTDGELKPKITVGWKLTGQTLTEGRDYTVNYTTDDNETQIAYKVTGVGNFRGESGEGYIKIVAPSPTPPSTMKDELGNNSEDYVTWQIDEKGTLQVSFGSKFSMPASYVDCYWRPYRSMIKKIVVTSSLAIPAGAFEDCWFVTEVELPDGLTKIMYNAFKGCESLKTMNIPSSVTTLCKDALPQNRKLVLHLPDDITDFDGYGALEYVKAFVKPGTTTESTLREKQGYFYYEDHPDFQLYDTGNGVLMCVKYSGSGGTVRIPDFVDFVQAQGLGDTFLVERVEIPGTVGRLSSMQNCHCLREVVIEPGNKLTELPSQFLSGCFNVTLFLPDNVTSIGVLNYYDYSDTLLVANESSPAIEWAKSQKWSWGDPKWTEPDGSLGRHYTTSYANGRFDGTALKATVTAPKDTLLIAAR